MVHILNFEPIMKGYKQTANLTRIPKCLSLKSIESDLIYILGLLKRSETSTKDLLHIYKAIIRSSLEHACPVWNTSLPIFLQEMIESVQQRCLKNYIPWEFIQRSSNWSTVSNTMRKKREAVLNIFQKDSNWKW